MQAMTIGTLAKKGGVGTGTLRYYERLGLLAPATRSPSGYRFYQREDFKRLRFIRRSQRLGFSLEEIGVLLKLSQNAGAQAADVKRLTEEKVADIDQRIKDLELMKRGLSALAQSCHGHGPVADCPILAALNADDEPAVEVL
ncbi:MAG TPA: MerR family DNA-binding protein [Acidiferrobacter sp.]|nr:MerR family DNA-binding protein [Acidiferrobacter sp.]